MIENYRTLYEQAPPHITAKITAAIQRFAT